MADGNLVGWHDLPLLLWLWEVSQPLPNGLERPWGRKTMNKFRNVNQTIFRIRPVYYYITRFNEIPPLLSWPFWFNINSHVVVNFNFHWVFPGLASRFRSLRSSFSVLINLAKIFYGLIELFTVFELFDVLITKMSAMMATTWVYKSPETSSLYPLVRHLLLSCSR